MSHSNYTASERRGILAIGIISLLLIGAGLLFSLCERRDKNGDNFPIVTTHPEMVDYISIESHGDNTNIKYKKQKISGSKKEKITIKKKPQKTYRRRSPLDEPVSNKR